MDTLFATTDRPKNDFGNTVGVLEGDVDVTASRIGDSDTFQIAPDEDSGHVFTVGIHHDEITLIADYHKTIDSRMPNHTAGLDRADHGAH
jgi:hypothetical protein